MLWAASKKERLRYQKALLSKLLYYPNPYQEIRSPWAKTLNESGRSPQTTVIPYFSARATPKLVGSAREAKKRTPRPWTFSITD